MEVLPKLWPYGLWSNTVSQREGRTSSGELDHLLWGGGGRLKGKRDMDAGNRSQKTQAERDWAAQHKHALLLLWPITPTKYWQYQPWENRPPRTMLSDIQNMLTTHLLQNITTSATDIRNMNIWHCLLLFFYSFLKLLAVSIFVSLVLLIVVYSGKELSR